ncbi:MAG: class I SAM-dependent methyltransferase [Clostridiales bacterium]|nr:class I SAM-dependent methyltransferase [Clostridiales bacterium]
MKQGEDGGYTAYNAQAIDRWVQEGWEWGRPITREAYARAKAGDWQVVLTPNIPVPRAWFGDLKGKRVLGLASGGAQQMPVFAAQGAICTVFDLSDSQLASERLVAQREGYEIQVVQGDMTRPFPFEDASFDLIFHPVSNCYVREVQPVWEACARVLAPGGSLLSGLDNGINYLFDDGGLTVKHALPFDALLDPDWEKKVQEYNDSLQFSHPIEVQIGGQLKAGFVLRDVYEDTNGEGPLKDFRVPCFFATWSVKAGKIAISDETKG